MTVRKPFPDRPWPLIALAAAVLILLSLARPIDHDESQYVAAAVLAAHGLPYRDFAYLQTPLQPLLLMPVAALAGGLAYPALRIANAVLGVVVLAGTWRAARAAGASAGAALLATELLAACDSFLFAVGVARNDALPAALLALALPLLLARGQDRLTARAAATVGLLLAAATAAKASYAMPALALGALSLIDRRLRPGWLAIGAVPPALLVLACWWMAPDAFRFDVLTFPVAAPAEHYRVIGQGWRLGLPARALDALKFLALGPALPALALLVRGDRQGAAAPNRWRFRLLILAGLAAALLPAPTWRQYLLPMLPPLFAWLALALDRLPPSRPWRIALMVFAAAGLAPSAAALAGGAPMIEAVRDARAIGTALDAAGFRGPVATLSPQLLPATGRLPDPRFAAGPFYFRSTTLLDAGRERQYRLISQARPDALLAAAALPAILVGGEDRWTSGDPSLDRALEDWARRHGWRLAAQAGYLRLYLPPVSSRP